MWRVLEVGEVPLAGDEWWYQEETVYGGYWTPCIGPFVHREVGKVVVRRKISEQGEAVQTSHNSDYTAVLEVGLKEYYQNKTGGYANTVYFREIAAHLNSAIKASQNCA